jgi:hypothetical protein
MAYLDKNIIITPNVGQSAAPNIRFLAANSSVNAQTITMTATTANDGTLMFSGNSGNLFSISSASPPGGNVLTIVGATTITGNLYITGSSNTITSGGTITTGSIFINSNTITTNTTISTGYNGFVVGPITIANNISVTVANNSRWVII